MKVAELLESRRKNWQHLEQLCAQLERRRLRKLSPATIARFAALYRAACADLALADAYQLPPNTVDFLHHLVGRAHNQLYRSRKFNLASWGKEMFEEVPRRLFTDNSLRLAFFLFWGVFLASMFLASEHSPVPDYDRKLLTQEYIDMMEEMYANPIGGSATSGSGEAQLRSMMAGWYLSHNTGIGLKVFAAGLLFGIGGLFATIYNAALIGAVFGHMTKVPQWENFSHFVTAHGPFELTAIVLSAAAGMRLGFALVDTRGLSRTASLRRAAKEAMPTMGAAMVLFILAALIEGFLSPSAAPYEAKAAMAVISSGLLMFYFIILGSKQGDTFAT